MALDFLNGSGVVQYVSPLNPLPIQNNLNRPLLYQTSWSPAASYAIGSVIGGGLITVNFNTITGLNFAGQWVSLKNITFVIVGSNSAGVGPQGVIFSAQPTTTFTDGSAPTWNSADYVKIQGTTKIPSLAATAAIGGTSFSLTNTQVNAQPWNPMDIQCDASGKTYIAFLCTVADTITTGATSYLTLEFNY